MKRKIDSSRSSQSGDQKITRLSAASPSLSEREILMDLFNTTNGFAWPQRQHWGTDMPLRQWKGVRVNAGHITGLNLSGNKLVGMCVMTINHQSINSIPVANLSLCPNLHVNHVCGNTQE